MDAITTESAVSVRGLRVALGEGELRREVLRGVDLELRPGEVVIVSGPSGSGKSTLVGAIGGLRRVTDGSVRVLGQELRGIDEAGLVAVRRRIGFVFQAHNLLGFLSAQANVALPMSLRSEWDHVERLRRAAELLDAVGLGDRMQHLPGKLSGGQRQRVAIARAMALDPGLILADEPTASLDAAAGRQVVDLLAGLAQRRGCAVVMVTHDPRILDVADRVIHIEDGQIVAGLVEVPGV